MSLQRFPDWPERLDALMLSRQRVAFRWGLNDCCMFAADAVLETTGSDLAGSLRGAYDSQDGAESVLAEHGGVRAIASARLGEPMDNPAYARRGDIVCVELEGRETLGVVVGAGQWACPGARGLVFRPMAEALTVWRV